MFKNESKADFKAGCMLCSSKLARATHCRRSLLGTSEIVKRLLREQRKPFELAKQMEGQESDEMRNQELMDAIHTSKKPFIALAPMIDQSELAFRMMMRELVKSGDKSPKERNGESWKSC